MSITISAKAQEVLNEQFKTNENNFFRIFIKGFGWGGPTFGIALDEAKDDEKDHYEKIENLNILVEKDLLGLYKNFSIDYSNGWLNKGFKVVPGLGGSSCS